MTTRISKGSEMRLVGSRFCNNLEAIHKPPLYSQSNYLQKGIKNLIPELESGKQIKLSILKLLRDSNQKFTFPELMDLLRQENIIDDSIQDYLVYTWLVISEYKINEDGFLLGNKEGLIEG